MQNLINVKNEIFFNNVISDINIASESIEQLINYKSLLSKSSSQMTALESYAISLALEEDSKSDKNDKNDKDKKGFLARIGETIANLWKRIKEAVIAAFNWVREKLSPNKKKVEETKETVKEAIQLLENNKDKKEVEADVSKAVNYANSSSTEKEDVIDHDFIIKTFEKKLGKVNYEKEVPIIINFIKKIKQGKFKIKDIESELNSLKFVHLPDSKMYHKLYTADVVKRKFLSASIKYDDEGNITSIDCVHGKGDGTISNEDNTDTAPPTKSKTIDVTKNINKLKEFFNSIIDYIDGNKYRLSKAPEYVKTAQALTDPNNPVSNNTESDNNSSNKTGELNVVKVIIGGIKFILTFVANLIIGSFLSVVTFASLLAKSIINAFKDGKQSYDNSTKHD